MNEAPYEIELVAPVAGEIVTHGGVLRIVVDRAISDFSSEELSQVNMFMIAGGFSAVGLREQPEVVEFVRRASKRAERVASVCTSGLLFAEAGVLDGHKVTTHWRMAKLLAAGYPKVDVKPDAIVCNDGKVWSSGGISAGVDLALAVVEHDLGADVARGVARMMVMYLSRPGGQSQFENPVADCDDVLPQGDMQIQEIIDLIRTHPTADLRRSALAERFNLTERTLARRFSSFTGMNVARFAEEARISHARLRLEDSNETLEEVANRSGFGSADSMRRIFKKHLSVSPRDYRARFKSAFRHDHASIVDTDAMS